MMSTMQQPDAGRTRVARSVLGIAREGDEGALRALCQMCSASGAAENRKACVLVTIYRRESDLFALLLREVHHPPISRGGSVAGGGGRPGGKWGRQAAGPTVVCDMALDDGVHLEGSQASGDTPLVVKVVNTCRPKSAYLLEFGRAVDLATFQGAFTAARGYFRQMLTLRTLVADSFWQGFASGAGTPVRNEPHSRPSEPLKPPPGVLAGEPEVGLRGKTRGPGACGIDSEALVEKISGLWASTAAAAGRGSGGEGGGGGGGGGGGNAAVGSGAFSPRVRSPAGAKSSSLSSTPYSLSRNRVGGGEVSDASWAAAAAAAEAVRGWPGATARGAAEKKANAEHNRACEDGEGKNCHKCQHNAYDKPSPRYECPNRKQSHVFCVRCIEKTFSLSGALLADGTKRYACPICEGFCPCKRCDDKNRKQGKSVLGDKETVDLDPASSSLAQYLPAPQLTHYEGLFAKYLQSLPALERVPTTEDVCFLCKEGGNLVECDEGTSWYRRVENKRESLGEPPPPSGGAFSSCGVPMEEEDAEGERDGEKGEEEQGQGHGERGGYASSQRKGGGGAAPDKAVPPRCKKVYHAYCMGFNVADDELSSCPRHACVDCAEEADYFCRFCPVSLCDEHFQTDPSGIIAETYHSLQHRVRRPFPRTRGGGFRPPAVAVSASAAGARRGTRGEGGKSSGGGGGGGDRIRRRSAGETIAQRRNKRAKRVEAEAAAAAVAAAATKPCADRRSSGVGEAGGGAGFGEHDFVCTGCKMAARRAVRQYGLLGSLETGGVVLPYGESEGSGDEQDCAIEAIIARPRTAPTVSSSDASVAIRSRRAPAALSQGTAASAAAAPALTTAAVPGPAANGTGGNSKAGEDELGGTAFDEGLEAGMGEAAILDEKEGAVAAVAAATAVAGRRGSGVVRSSAGAPEGKQPIRPGRSNGGGSVPIEPAPRIDVKPPPEADAVAAAATAAPAAAAPAPVTGAAAALAAAAAAANNAVAALAAERYFSLFTRRDSAAAAVAQRQGQADRSSGGAAGSASLHPGSDAGGHVDDGKSMELG